MIQVTAEYDTEKRLRGFDVRNHGLPVVCSAVSLLVQNTINCIEKLTDDPMAHEYNESEALIAFELFGPPGHDTELLLDAMMIGLCSVQEAYPKEIAIIEKEVKP